MAVQLRFRAFVFMSVVAAGSAMAQAPCRVLDPELAGAYEGGCKDGLADGFGTAKGRATYQGEFKAGRKNGQGVKSWPSGDRYEGGFVEDRKQGQGKYTWGAASAAPGDRYEGGYLADRRHGAGTYIWASGERYSGEWANDDVVGGTTPAMLSRARAQIQAEAAVSKPGATVCREMRVGISERDLVRGTVVDVENARIRVRISEPGRFPNAINGVNLARDAVVTDSVLEWAPCL